MKLHKIIDPLFYQAVTELSNSQLPVATSYALADILEKLQDERLKFEAVRQTLLDRHGDKDDKGTLKLNEAKTEYVLKDKEAFDKEYKELLEIDVSLPNFKLSQLGDAKLSPKAMLQLKELITP